MVEPQTKQTIWHLRVAYWISKPIRAQEHSRACAHTHTHRRRHATHALTDARAYTYTRQEWLHEQVSMLRYTYTASLIIVCMTNINQTVQ